jgi:hypothetical protein
LRARPNKNARRWNSKDELRLFAMVHRMQREGLTERQAIDRIAAERAALQLPRYKGRGTQYLGKASRARGASALWRRWTRIKRKHPRDLVEAVGPSDWPTSPLEQRLRELDLGPLFARLAGDKRNG